MPDAGDADSKAQQSTWAGLLKEAGKQVIPLLLTAGSLIGFVAFAGAVIVWTRFSAAKVPPDQAVNAVPRDELVAIGSSLLMIFGFFGVLALVGAFLIDRGARATPGMSRALLGLFLIEAVTTIVIVGGLSLEQTVIAAELVALPIGAALWATLLERYVSLHDDLWPRGEERTEPRTYDMLVFEGGSRLVTQLPAVAIAIALALMALGASDRLLLVWMSAAMLVLLVGATRRMWNEAGPKVQEIDAERTRAEGERDAELEAERARDGRAMLWLAPEAAEKVRERWRTVDRERKRERLLNDRPKRLRPTGQGAAIGLLLLAAAVALPAVRLGVWWVAVSIAAAAILTVGLWRVSALTTDRVIWYGIAIFLSVPLFGTLTAMARNVADPQVQPMALIRSTDGPYEAIQGLYVTEARERVYFATVATEGCTNRLRSHSGRLEWVPKSEVVAMSVGPLQDVHEAAGSALEMAYALTPAVETPAGGNATLTTAEKQTAEAEHQSTGPGLDKRLENTGPAVRPYYGAGLSLTPEDASPGEPVTLRMSAPNNDVEGFGATRNGHTVRVGGVRAKILKEQARSAKGAEYLRTSTGVMLKLRKGGPFVQQGQEDFKPITESEEQSRFEEQSPPAEYVGLNDPRVLAVTGNPPVGEGEDGERVWYLKIEGEGPSGRPRLAEPNVKVTLKGQANGIALPVESRPFGQAWGEREIRFKVPENASTGAVTVECSQLAGQPLLRISHAPEARIAVHMKQGSNRVVFDGGRSTDADHEPLSLRWNVSGLQRGNLERMHVDLPSRLGAYSVKMTATDKSGATDTVELALLRLPASLFASGSAEPENGAALREARKELREEVREEPPTAIEIDGHADYPGSARENAALSMRRAVGVREALLGASLTGAPGDLDIPVRTLGYGEDCPTSAGSGPNPRDRRVDVFVLSQGVSIAPTPGCAPRRFGSSEWQLLTCHDKSAQTSAPGPQAGYEADLHKLIEGAADYLFPPPPHAARCVR